MNSLFAPNYSSAKFPEPREFQNTAHEKLRQGFKDGHRCQLLMAPTGGGKTYLGMRIIHEALQRGKKTIFVCDRTTLINQTSAVADSYGLAAHSIVQAGHWRFDSRSNFQIASVQTLARRSWPDADVIVIDECFTGDVEVLTQHGFIRFDELPPGVKCAQFDGGRIGFVDPTAYIDKPFTGEMVRIHSDGLCDLTMTPDHELLMRSVSGWKKFAAKDAPLNSRWEMAAAGDGIGDGLHDLSSIERLCICLQADGSIHNRHGSAETSLSFTFAKQRKIERFLELMQEGCFRFTETKSTRGRRRFLVHGLPLMSKRIWEHFDLSTITAEKARNIISEMVEWDGSKATDSCWYYSSIVKSAADFFQCVALLAGYKTRMTVQRDERSDKFSDVHRLFIQIGRSMIGAQRLKRDIVYHHGRVYCIRVPSGNIVVRRGGKVVVTGNCHTQYKAWTEHIQNTDAAVIGLSATPFSKGLGKLFSNHVNAATMHELTQSGVLVPMRVFSCTKINMDGAETSGGEWTDRAAEQRGMEVIGDVVTEWQKHAENAKTIFFGATIAHCMEMCRQFNEAGIPAATYTSETTESERKELLEEFSKPDSFYRILLSVEALAKGFDVKDVGCVGDCRPLRKSFSSVIQMHGRGARSSPETGKKYFILLDFSGNVIRFANDYSDLFYNGLESLDMGEKLDKTIRRDNEEKEESKCPSCGFSPFGKRCISCGHERQKQNLVDHLPGEMTEIMIGKSKLADDKKHLYEQVCTYTRSHGNPETARQRAWYLFQDLAGCKPSPFWKFEDQPNTQLTRNTLNHIKRKQIAFAKANQRRQA